MSLEAISSALWRCLVLVSVPCLWVQPVGAETTTDLGWSPSEIKLLKTLSIDSLPRYTADWRNPLAGNPHAVALGRRLFSDDGLSGDGKLSCQSCHPPDRWFQDGQVTAKGQVRLSRNTPSLVGVRRRAWFYWDGRKDSLWAQALEPIENPNEMNGTRSAVARRILEDDALRRQYEQVFEAAQTGDWSTWPLRASPLGGRREREAWAELTPEEQRRITRIFVNVGLAIAAFEATLELPVTRFDRFVRAVLANDKTRAGELLSEREQRGLRRFISGDSGCVSCHLGPRFTTDSFHNIGTGRDRHGQFDAGRFGARDALLNDEFNCRGPWSATDARCHHLDTIQRVEVISLTNGSFLTPGLRNLLHSAPYMHDGRFSTLKEVLEHYRSPPEKSRHRHELPRLNLSDQDAQDIVAFLETLSVDQDKATSAPTAIRDE